MSYTTLTTNLAKVRHERIAGQTYLVAPMVMITEGVHVGSNGALLYEADELEESADFWNMRPVVNGHPEVNGRPVSANSPEVFRKHFVGVILNTLWDVKANKLRAEAWFEDRRLRSVSPQTHAAILAGRTPIEVSTGLFTDNIQEAGVWNGKRYVAIARNLRPDHLAIVARGACSISDGCGLLTNEREDVMCDCNDKELTDNLAGEDGFLPPPHVPFRNPFYMPSQEEIEAEQAADEDHDDFSSQGGFENNEVDDDEPLVAPTFNAWNARKK